MAPDSQTTATEDFSTSSVPARPTGSIIRHRRTRSLVSGEELARFREEVLGYPPSAVSERQLTLAELDRVLSVPPSLSPRPSIQQPSTSQPFHVAFCPEPPTNAVGVSVPINLSVESAAELNWPKRMSRPGSAPVNGAGPDMAPMGSAIPMNAGHHMDLNHLYQMVLDLSDVLRNNREMTKGIVDGAEEAMKRSSIDGASLSINHANGEISAARIAELERLLSKERATVQALQREREENLLLIEDWESAAGKMVAQIRDYCQNNQMSYLAQKRHYNELLQAERDSHLESRIDRDHWYEQSLRYAAMIRQAYQLRCEEDDLPTHVIEGLQNEVRAYRTALGMETQKPEEEFGWQYLKDVPRWPGSPNKKES